MTPLRYLAYAALYFRWEKWQIFAPTPILQYTKKEPKNSPHRKIKNQKTHFPSGNFHKQNINMMNKDKNLLFYKSIKVLICITQRKQKKNFKDAHEKFFSETPPFSIKKILS